MTKKHEHYQTCEVVKDTSSLDCTASGIVLRELIFETPSVRIIATLGASGLSPLPD